MFALIHWKLGSLLGSNKTFKTMAYLYFFEPKKKSKIYDFKSRK